MKIDTSGKRKKRADLRPFARPQSGVDDLKGRFDRPAQDIPGVPDSRGGAGERSR